MHPDAKFLEDISGKLREVGYYINIDDTQLCRLLISCLYPRLKVADHEVLFTLCYDWNGLPSRICKLRGFGVFDIISFAEPIRSLKQQCSRPFWLLFFLFWFVQILTRNIMFSGR